MRGRKKERKRENERERQARKKAIDIIDVLIGHA